LLDVRLCRKNIHRIEQDLFQDHHQPAGPDLSLVGFVSDGKKRTVSELNSDAVELEFFLILLDERILRLGKDLDECLSIKLIERTDNRQASDKFRDQAVLDQIDRLEFLDRIDVPLLIALDLGLEA